MHPPLSYTVAARPAIAFKRGLHNVNNIYRASFGAFKPLPSNKAFPSLPWLPSQCHIYAHTKARLDAITGAKFSVGLPKQAHTYRGDDDRRYNTSIASAQNGSGLRENLTERAWTTSRIEVPVGGSGIVLLDIHYLKLSVSQSAEPTKLVKDTLVYIPPGPTFHGDNSRSEGNDEEDVLETLLDRIRDTSHLTQEQCLRHISTVVRINYRLSPYAESNSSSPDRRFPFPIHDVMVACDWIQENITSARHSHEQSFDLEQETRTLVFGSHIGGSLALMLALTRPNDFHAVVAHDPVVEWVGLDESAVPLPENSHQQSVGRKRNKIDSEETKVKIRDAANALIDLRTKLFRNPSSFFDPFASPLLFLRAPGRDTPLWRTARPEPEGVQECFETIKEAMKKEGGIEVSEKNTKEVVNERGYGPYDDDWHAAQSKDQVIEQEFHEPDVLSPIKNEADTLNVHQIATDLSSLVLHDNKVRSTATQPETDLSSHTMPTQVIYSSPDDSSNNIIRQQTVTDLSSPNTPDTALNSLSDSRSALSVPPPADPSSPSDPTKLPSRRRKVLRRWPPIGRPEDVDLPFVKIYSTLPPSPGSDDNTNGATDLSYVLHPQAKEMVSIMQRACFWGREKSLGEERVLLEEITIARESAHKSELARARQTDSGDEMSDITERAVRWLREIASVHK